jgi:hypothetical protein
MVRAGPALSRRSTVAVVGSDPVIEIESAGVTSRNTSMARSVRRPMQDLSPPSFTSSGLPGAF